MNGIPALHLEVALVRGGRVVRTWSADEGASLRIGSAAGCTIRVAGHPDLQAHHATVVLEDGVASLVAEPGATVFLGEEPVDVALPQPDDVVRVGPLELRIRAVRHVDYPLLHVEMPGGRAKRVKMKPGRFLVGDDQGALRIPGAGLTSRHAILEVGEHVVLHALDGGVHMDGKSVERAVLGSGRVARLGEVRMRLVTQVLPADAPPATPEAASPRAESLKPPPVVSRPRPEPEPEPAEEPEEYAGFVEPQPTRDPEPSPPPAPAEAAPEHNYDARDDDDVDLFEDPDPTIDDETPEPVHDTPTGVIVPAPPLPVRAPPAAGDAADAESRPWRVTPLYETPAPTPRREPSPGLAPRAVAPAVPPPDVERTAAQTPGSPVSPPAVGLPNGAELVVENHDESVAIDDVAEAFLAPRAVEAANRPIVADLVVRIDGRVRQAVAVDGAPWSWRGVRVALDSGRVRVQAEADWSAELVRSGRESEPVAASDLTLERGDALRLRRDDTEIRVQAAPRAAVPMAAIASAGVAIGLPIAVVAAAALLALVGVFLSNFAPVEGARNYKPEQEVFAEVRIERPPERKPPPPVQAAAERAPTVTVKEVETAPPPAPARQEQQAVPKAVDDVLARLKGSGLRGTGGKLALKTSALGTSGGLDIGQRLAGVGSGKVELDRKVTTAGLVTKSGDAAGSVSALTASKRGGARGKVTQVSSGIKVEGSLDRAHVRRVINGSMNRIQGCYERRLVQVPTLSGRLTFDWTVQGDGSVSGTRIRADTTGDATFASCVQGVVSGLKFNAPEGGDVTISYPFLFSPAS